MRYFVTGIYNLQQNQILMHLNSIGTVSALTVMNDANGNSRGFAFVDGFFKTVPAVIDVKTQLIVVKNAIPAVKGPVFNVQKEKVVLRGGTFWAEVAGEIAEGLGENEESCEFSE
ncbi:RNA_recognition motif domain [Hexamita inflata]|uniref:RNA recognition motif domain n=1 Tax=Hexamita inflata TaxID=28002 RepID=A0AA86PTJ4_9EUKA|nr:RNA recognition motif domain [Hexamita inflata]